MARQVAMILLTGWVYQQFVTNICAQGDEFGYHCNILVALNYIWDVSIEIVDQLLDAKLNPLIFY